MCASNPPVYTVAIRGGYLTADDASIARWDARQHAFAALQRQHGVAAWRADLAIGEVRFDGPEGAVLVARAALIATWGLATRVVVMAWANAEAVGGATIAPLEGFLPRYVGVDAHDAEALALRAAEAVGAQAFVRSIEGGVWAWIALWEPRPVEVGRGHESAAEAFVARAVGSLRDAADDDTLCGDDLALRCGDFAATAVRIADDPGTDPLAGARLREFAAAVRAAAPSGHEPLDFRERAMFAAAISERGPVGFRLGPENGARAAKQVFRAEGAEAQRSAEPRPTRDESGLLRHEMPKT